MLHLHKEWVDEYMCKPSYAKHIHKNLLTWRATHIFWKDYKRFKPKSFFN